MPVYNEVDDQTISEFRYLTGTLNMISEWNSEAGHSNRFKYSASHKF